MPGGQSGRYSSSFAALEKNNLFLSEYIDV